MYYRIAIQRARDQLDGPSTWQWKSTVLSSSKLSPEELMGRVQRGELQP